VPEAVIPSEDGGLETAAGWVVRSAATDADAECFGGVVDVGIELVQDRVAILDPAARAEVKTAPPKPAELVSGLPRVRSTRGV
jgi:hypothetical protein